MLNLHLTEPGNNYPACMYHSYFKSHAYLPNRRDSSMNLNLLHRIYVVREVKIVREAHTLKLNEKEKK